MQDLGEPRVPTLGHPRGVARRFFFFGVVVDVEVVGLENAEIEPWPPLSWNWRCDLYHGS